MHTRAVLHLAPQEGWAEIRDGNGAVLHAFALRQAELILATDRATRGGPAHWTRVVELRDGSVSPSDFKPFEKVRDQARNAAERAGLPSPIVRPREGFLDLNRGGYRVVRVAARGKACPACGRAPNP
jgi:hypothetical protein